MNKTGCVTIQIDPDIEAYLKTAREWNESTPSAVLRRLLGLDCGTPVAVHPQEKSELQKLLTSTEFTYAPYVVGRFLVLLRWLHDRDPEGFAKVEKIQGRGRRYFAKDPATLEASGQSVNPKQIPGTPYWVITTTPTTLKQEIVERVMRELGYSLFEVKAATEAIESAHGS